MFKSQKLHAFLLKSGALQNDVYRCNLLLQSYINSGSLSEANKLVHLLPHSNIISYNTLISGLFASNQINEALKLFSTTPEADTRSWNIAISGCIRNPLSKHYAITLFLRIRRTSNNIKPDNFTYTILIPCLDYELGRQIHGEVIKVCSNSDAFLGTNLLRLYAETGKIDDAQKVFDEMSYRDLVTWNVLISCYSKFGKGDMCLELFRQLFREGVSADEYTFAIILNEFTSCLQVFEAMQIHSLMIQFGLCSDRFLNNSLVNLYSKSGFIVAATRLFEEMPVRDVVSWSSMIDGFCQSGYQKEAILLLHKMQLAKVEPNSFTFGSLLSACGCTNAFATGKQLHSLVLKYALETDIVVGSAIVDMYSKCGEMNDAWRLFRRLPERDLVTWNGMICGFAQNGEALKALKLFNEMVQSKTAFVIPNHVTFIGVLSACSHSGLVSEGCFYFEQMIHEYSIQPKAEHHTCMVDILARAGLLEEAQSLILRSPFKTDSVMWGSLLGACKVRGNLEMARSIASRLVTYEPDNSSSYVLLANTCTGNKEWDDALQVREVMHDSGAQKVVGCSWTEIRNCQHYFVSGQKDHPQYGLISEVLQRLFLQMTDW